VCVCVCVCYWLCEGVIKKCGQIKCIKWCLTSVKASSEGVSGFIFSVFDADCDSETIFMLSRVHRPLCLVLFILTELKCLFFYRYQYATMDQVSEMLPTVLQYFK